MRTVKEFKCNCPEDDGTTMCWNCGRVAPDEEFAPRVHKERLGRRLIRTKITYFYCKDGCRQE